MNAALTGVTLAAAELGWEVVGIRNGFAGLLEPDAYPEGGLVTMSPQFVESLDQSASGVLGQRQEDPFHVRRLDEDGMVEEVDRSDELLAALQAQRIDAVVSIVGRRGLSILYKLHRKGLNTVCIPRSVENDIAQTMVTFGFNSALSFTIEMLDRARQAARSSREIVVVEVEGRQAGWLALQSGIAAGADAILIPELPTDLKAVAEHLRGKMSRERPFGLVVVAEGLALEEEASTGTDEPSPLRASLSPLAAGESEQLCHPEVRPGGADCRASVAAVARRGDSSTGARPLGARRPADRNRPSAGHCLWCRRGSRTERRPERGDGVLPTAGYRFRAAGGRHQQSADGACRQRDDAHRPNARYLPRRCEMSTTDSQITGTVLNIQRYCSHDGPGIRTTVFLKVVRCAASGAVTRRAFTRSRSSPTTPGCAAARRNAACA